MPTTTFMLLVLPTPGSSNDFTGESQLMTAFGLIDAHDHSPGKGTLVPSTGLNINADLPFAGFNASGLRSVRLSSQGSTLALLLDVNSIYSSGGNLYYNNGSGQAVQITSGSGLSASSIGGISGLAAPASVAYSGGTYIFTSNTNKAAIVDMGPVIIRDTGTSALGITLQSPTGLAGAYAITLPGSLPAGTFPLTLTAGGIMAASLLTTAHISASAGILGTQLAAATVARTNLIALGQQISSTCGTVQQTASATYTNIPNLTLSLTTTGRPVMLMLVPDGTTNDAFINGVAGATAWGIAFARAGTAIAQWKGFVTNPNIAIVPASPVHIDPVGAGTYTYTAQFKGDGSNQVSVGNWKLAAYEL